MIDFDLNRDCHVSVWKESQSLEDWKIDVSHGSFAFHCSSGDFVPKSAVCNGEKDCYDGSDENYGCSKGNLIKVWLKDFNVDKF